MTSANLNHLECLRCGTHFPAIQFHSGCPVCAQREEPSNLKTVYDLDRAQAAFEPEALLSRAWNMWRYDALLPFSRDQAVTLNEGGTPLVPATRLAEHLGLQNLWIKDESRNPTWSFKDRSAAVAATHARHLESPALVVASTGNAAAATSAYARRAHLPAIVLFAKSVEPFMSAFVRSYSALVVAAPTKPDRWTFMRHCVEEWNCYPDGNYVDPPVGSNPFLIDGYKTIGFEIWEQLGRRAPDWIIAPVGFANCLAGIFKGFQELGSLDLADMPRLGAAEIYGSLTQALEQGSNIPQAAKTDRPTVAFSMATAQNTYQALQLIRESGGFAAQVGDQEILGAQKLLVETEGIFGETASATALAALLQRLDEGTIEKDSEVVLILTSTGLKSLSVTAETLSESVPLAHDLDEFVVTLRDRFGFDPPNGRDGAG